MSGLFAELQTPLLSATRLYQQLRPSEATVDVMGEDWDTLVILDACRYDMFKRLSTLPGTLEPRYSKGSATDEFVEANFGDSKYEDVVYVTANPRVNLAFNGRFHEVINVWQDGWDDDLQTVPPETVADATTQALETYPNKRVISHFIQPHAPFIGEYAQGNLVYHSTLSGHRPDADDGDSASENVWTLLRRGEVDKDVVKRAYDENLEIALPHVERIMDAEMGKTVVTSDHGNLMGERIAPFMKRFYGHPSRFGAPDLLRIPWLEHNNGSRREIFAEASKQKDAKLGDDVSEKLKDLGYV
jgi:hypothetical protein